MRESARGTFQEAIKNQLIPMKHPAKHLLTLLAATALCASSQAAVVFYDGFDATNYPNGGSTTNEYLANGWSAVYGLPGGNMGVSPAGAIPTESVLWGNASASGQTQAALEYNYTNAIHEGDILTITPECTRVTAYPYVREISMWDGANAGTRVVVTNLTANGWALGEYSTWYSPPVKQEIPSVVYICSAADEGMYPIFKYGHGNNWGETADITFSITSVTNPVYLTQPPATLAYSVGETANITVLAAGKSLTYQWKKNGADISGATSATLTLPTVTTADSAIYTCLATDAYGTTLSSACALTVTPQMGGGASLSLGINFSRRDSALGGGNAPDSWYPNPTSGSAYGLSWNRWAATTAGDATGYQYILFGAGGMTVNWNAKNTWSTGDDPTTVTNNNDQINYGYLDDGGAGYSVTLTGLTAPGGVGFTAYVVRTIASSDNATGFTNAYVVDNTLLVTNTLTYGPMFPSVQPSSGAAAVSSTSATLTNDSITITSASPSNSIRGTLTGFIITDKPLLLAQPQAPTNAAFLFNGVGFTVGGADAFGVPPLAYQWQKDGTNIPGATAATYSVASASTNDTGSYTLIVTNAYGTVASTPVPVSVSAFVTPFFLSQPQNHTAYVGGQSSFNAAASGGSLSYQWLKGGVAGTPIPNATNTSLLLTGLALTDDSDYTVVVSNPVGTNSATAHLTVLPLPSTNTYLGAVLADSPATLWRLGESAGTTAYDAWGVNNGTYSGSYTLGEPGLITGDPDTSVLFTNSKVMVPFASNLNNPAGPFSVEFWTVPSDLGAECIISSQNRSGSRAGYTIFQNNGGSGFSALIGNNASGTIFVNGATTIQAGVKYHVVLTYDGINADLYVNGGLDATAVITNGTDFNPNTVAPFQIGARNGGDGYTYDGIIDEVAVYGYALTQAQVQRHAFLVTPLQITMAPATGVVVDSKPAGTPHNGQTTTATWVATDAGLTNSRAGAMQFNASTPSVITAAQNADFDNATNGTICFWLRYDTNNLGGGSEAAIIMDRRNAASSGSGTVLAVEAGGANAGTIFFQANPSGANAFNSYSYLVNDGNWHFVAVTYGQQINDVVTIYVDNSAQSTAQANTAAWGPWPNLNLMLGQSRDSYWMKFNGALDDFRIYNRQLTTTEIDSVATTGDLVDTNALVVRYNFDTAPVSGALLNSTPTQGVLQNSPVLPGLFSDLPGATLPYLMVVPKTGNEFFRVRAP